MILLDTHVWVWWVSGFETLSPAAEEIIERGVADGLIHISSISVWEVALLAERGRLRLTMDVGDWIARSESLPFVHFIPVDNRIAMRATRLPGPLHSDPADRFIIATAEMLGASLITRDERLLSYPHITTIW